MKENLRNEKECSTRGEVEETQPRVLISITTGHRPSHLCQGKIARGKAKGKSAKRGDTPVYGGMLETVLCVINRDYMTVNLVYRNEKLRYRGRGFECKNTKPENTGPMLKRRKSVWWKNGSGWMDREASKHGRLMQSPFFGYLTQYDSSRHHRRSRIRTS